ncbi:MAG: porin [Thiobacillaceae bacterium]
MQKKLITLALASAFAVPAFAATSNVDIYGQFDVSYSYVDGINSNPAPTGVSTSANRVDSNVSRIGLKGSEDLGDGLAAIWQWEQGINLDAGAESSGKTAFGTQRDTFVGLKGGFGTVLGGTHNTPYKDGTGSLDPFADEAGDYNAIIGTFEGYNTSDLRLGNVLAYVTPTFSGLTAAVATSFLKETGMDNHGNTPSAYTGTVMYANGPLFADVGYEQANDVGTTIGLSDVTIKSWKVGAGYTLDALTVNALYDHIELDNRLPGGGSVDRGAWGLNGVYNIGNIGLKLGFYDAMDVSGNNVNGSNTGAKLYEGGVDYNLSKRTKLYAVYARTANDANATYCVGGGQDAGFGGSGLNSGNVCSTTPGQAESIFSLGMRHAF